MAGAPIGNTNAVNGRPSTRALQRAIARRSGVPDADAPVIDRFQCLIDAWDKQLDAALDAGDLAALKEMTDRLEGKSVSRTELTGADGGSLSIVAVEYQDGAKDPRQVPE